MAVPDAISEPAQTIAVRRHRTDLDTIAPLIQQAIVQPPTTEIQSSVQHEDGPPSNSLLR